MEKERRARLRELTDDLKQFAPGTFGCHELLDRVNVLGDAIEEQLLEHASCVQNADWYRLADRAARALRELYQRVGAAHLNGNHAEVSEKPIRRKRTG